MHGAPRRARLQATKPAATARPCKPLQQHSCQKRYNRGFADTTKHLSSYRWLARFPGL